VPSDPIVFTIFLIFSGAAVVATLALYARQTLIVAYIVLGMAFGPGGLGLVDDPAVVRQTSAIGIMFLLFLLGLNLHPQKLWKLLQEATVVTGASALLFALLGASAGLLLGFSRGESLVLGATLMFSSTILGLKLLPTTVLHHQRTGEIIISVLLLQDIIAILILLWLQTLGRGSAPAVDIALSLLALPGLTVFAALLQRYLLLPLIRRFDRIQEYIFLVAIGWCLGIAELAAWLGLSHEIGAFLAGVALATSPIARFIAENLKPLRDFFLIMFFFSLGAGFDGPILRATLLPAAVLALAILVIKPLVFAVLFRYSGERAPRALEIGVRLGQISEFSLLIAVLAQERGAMGAYASHLVQVGTLLSFIASSYLIVLRYPTPIAVSDDLRRD
jgi:Kef-type K+ transport system membrane component KefB